MTSLTFYGGVNEVGGNKFLLETGKSRVFLDFGMSFTQFGKFFDEFLQPRKCNGIGDFVELGLLPDLKGLYREDYLEKMKIKPDKTAYDAVLLNHAHADHCSYIHFLRKDIPVYCSEESSLIMKALEDTSSTGWLDFLNLKESFKFKPQKRDPTKFSRIKGEECQIPRKFEVFKKKQFSLKDLEVTVCPTCHSLAGSTAFLIESKDARIAYTGDFRFHGYKAELTKKFVSDAASFEPDVLLCEGTRIDDNSGNSEEDVFSRAGKVVSSCKKLVLVNFPIRDTDRLKTFYDVAVKNNRKLVVSLKQAYLLKLLSGKVDVPSIDDKNLRIFIPYKSWGCLKDPRFPENIQYQDYDRWEYDFINHKNAVLAEEIRKNEKEYLMRLDSFELKHLIDLKPSEGSIFIKSVCEPFNEEMFLDHERIDNWLKHFKLFPAAQIHASGHANGFEIKNMLQEIKPKLVIPIHTDKAEMFKDVYDKVRLVKVREKVEI